MPTFGWIYVWLLMRNMALILISTVSSCLLFLICTATFTVSYMLLRDQLPIGKYVEIYSHNTPALKIFSLSSHSYTNYNNQQCILLSIHNRMSAVMKTYTRNIPHRFSAITLLSSAIYWNMGMLDYDFDFEMQMLRLMLMLIVFRLRLWGRRLVWGAMMIAFFYIIKRYIDLIG